MKVKRGEIMLEGIQIKSLAKFKALAAAVNTIEEECGVFQVTITLKNIFFCPWIDREQCQDTHMERLLLCLVDRLK